MIPTSYFEQYVERNKVKLNKSLEKDFGARVVEQGVLVQDVHTTNAKVVTVVYLVRPIDADLSEVKLATNVFNAFVRMILKLLQQLKGE